MLPILNRPRCKDCSRAGQSSGASRQAQARPGQEASARVRGARTQLGLQRDIPASELGQRRRTEALHLAR